MLNKCGHIDQKHYAKGLCAKCYRKEYSNKHGKTNQIKWLYKYPNYYKELMRKRRAIKNFNITFEQYEELISSGCKICGFKIIVDLHHKDKNKYNNVIINLIPLCPNHHKMAHMNLLNIN